MPTVNKNQLSLFEDQKLLNASKALGVQTGRGMHGYLTFGSKLLGMLIALGGLALMVLAGGTVGLVFVWLFLGLAVAAPLLPKHWDHRKLIEDALYVAWIPLLLLAAVFATSIGLLVFLVGFALIVTPANWRSAAV